MKAPDAITTWDEFPFLFKRHHIPDSIMERKREEFCNLSQGSKNVLAYRDDFLKLAHYAGDEVSTDAKKVIHVSQRPQSIDQVCYTLGQVQYL
jgi:hypothetical protein